jgi:hypothetical protein
VKWVLFAFLRAGEIKIATETIRNGEVGLLNTTEHLLVQLFLQRRGLVEENVGIGILSVEVGEDFRIFLVTEPGVVVNAEVAMENGFDGLAAGDRGLRRGVFQFVGDDELGTAMVALVSGFITLSEVARRENGVPAG